MTNGWPERPGVPITFDCGKVHDVAFYEDWQTIAKAVEEAARNA